MSKVKDKSLKAAILSRVNRMATGNFGDYKYIAAGIYELRIFRGPSFRVYFAQPKADEVLILHGGPKSNQQQDDINKAQIYWKDYLRRVK